MPFKSPVRLNKEYATNLFSQVENFLFDCDGVIWNWPHSISGSVEFINKLKANNKRCFFITNNSTKTRKTYVEMLKKVGVQSVSENDIVCTSWILARYLKGLNFQDKCYVVGSPAIGAELDQVNIKHYGVGSNLSEIPDPGSYNYEKEVKLDPTVKCVVAGFDYYFNYPKLVKATSYAYNKSDCLFIATNDDAQFPSLGFNVVIPGTGTIVNALKTSIGRDPIILGKPYHTMWDVLRQEHNLDPKKSIMIGDRLDTDIAMAANCSLGYSLAVLSGVSREDDILRLGELLKNGNSNSNEAKCVPDYYAASLGEFGEFIQDEE